PGIDSTPKHSLCNNHGEKNLGPDQRAPVIARAIGDNELNSLPFQAKPLSNTSTVWVLPFHSRRRRMPGRNRAGVAISSLTVAAAASATFSRYLRISGLRPP